MLVTPPLDRLLSGRRDRLGVHEKEAILQAVLQGTKPKRVRYFRWASALVTAALVLGLASLLLPPEEDLRAKGGESSAIELSCHPGSSDPCRVGDRLYFRTFSADKYVAAFAKTATGEVVWFLPSADDVSAPATKDGFLHEASMIPASMTDNVTVHVVLSDVPLTRALVRSLYDDGAKTTAKKLERSLRIER